MTRPEATIVYQSRWLSVVGFFTPITHFSRSQCEKIQVPIYQSFLPKMGYNRNILLAIRYGPPKYGEAGLTHIFTEQVVIHLQLFMGTLRQQSELADTLIISLSTIQLISGNEELFLNRRKKDLPYILGRMRNMNMRSHLQ